MSNGVSALLSELIQIDSPIGYTTDISKYVFHYLENLGYIPESCKCGGVYCSLNESLGKHIVITAHMDTLGAMVKKISADGHLEITPLGGLNANNIESENCRIITRNKHIITGSIHLKNASIHVNDSYDETKRTFDTIEVLLDADVCTEKEVQELGIDIGDIVAIEPRFTITESGYIKSRFLDDKAGVVVILELARLIKKKKKNLKNKISLFFSVAEEVGYGAAFLTNRQIDELIAIDMGCVGDNLKCTEKQVSICAKDSGGPYNHELVTSLINTAKSFDIDFAIDVYPSYRSDAEVALRAGVDAKHALIGMGVYASHGYERTHISGVKSTIKLLEKYIID